MQAWQMLQGLQFHILREARRKNELLIPKEHAYRAPKSTCCCFDRLPLQEAALQNYICLLSWLIVPVWHTLVPNSYCRKIIHWSVQYKYMYISKLAAKNDKVAD